MINKVKTHQFILKIYKKKTISEDLQTIYAITPSWTDNKFIQG